MRDGSRRSDTMTLLPSHPTLMMPDPLSVCEEDWQQEEVSKWKLISTLLSQCCSLPPPNPVEKVVSLARPSLSSGEELVCETNWKNLEDILTTLQPGLSSCDTLRSVLTSDEDKGHHFFRKTFPVMISLALRMPNLFPSGQIPILHPDVDSEVSFTREQIACLLVHIFLCSIHPAKWNKFWVNFHIWYLSNSKPVVAYLKSLLAYFKQLDSDGVPPSPQEVVTFRRCVLHSHPHWKDSSTPIEQVVPSNSLDPLTNVEVAFTNKDVGFGVSGTQEEAKLAQSPEACVVMLLAPTLLDNEALIIRGARKVAKFSGIGRDLIFTGTRPLQSSQWESRTIIAIDALELDEVVYGTERPSGVTVIAELSRAVLDRELGKSFCGFSSARYPDSSSVTCDRTVISTGHWGCGAFGGNKEAKSLIQVMSCVYSMYM